MAVLLITHNMGVVADLADRVLVMRNGRMVERGEVVSLFSQPFTDYTRQLLGLGAQTARRPVRCAIADRAVARAAAGPAVTPALAFRAVDVDYPGRLGRPSFRALHEVTRRAGAGSRCWVSSASPDRASPPSGGPPSDCCARATVGSRWRARTCGSAASRRSCGGSDAGSASSRRTRPAPSTRC